MTAIRKATKKAEKSAPADDIHILTVQTTASRYTIRDPSGCEQHYTRLGPALETATQWADHFQEAISICNSYGTIVTITPKGRRGVR